MPWLRGLLSEHSPRRFRFDYGPVYLKSYGRQRGTERGFSPNTFAFESRSRYSDWLRAGPSGDRIPVGARFSAPVQTGPGAHPASCKIDTGSLLGVKSGRGVKLTPHPLLVPWSWKIRAMPLLPPVRPVQSLSACTRVTFTFTITFYFCFPLSGSLHQNSVLLFILKLLFRRTSKQKLGKFED